MKRSGKDTSGKGRPTKRQRGKKEEKKKVEEEDEELESITEQELYEKVRDEAFLRRELEKSMNPDIWPYLEAIGFEYNGGTYTHPLMVCKSTGKKSKPALYKFEGNVDPIRTVLCTVGIPKDPEDVDDDALEPIDKLEIELWARTNVISKDLHGRARSNLTFENFEYRFLPPLPDVQVVDLLQQSYCGDINIIVSYEESDEATVLRGSPKPIKTGRRSRTSTPGRLRGSSIISSATKKERDDRNVPNPDLPTTKMTLEELRVLLRMKPDSFQRGEIEDMNVILALEMWVATCPTPLPEFGEGPVVVEDEEDGGVEGLVARAKSLVAAPAAGPSTNGAPWSLSGMVVSVVKKFLPWG